MLPRQSRLHQRKDIELVVKGGHRIATPGVVIYWQSASSTKISCVVGKRVSPLAVRRHYYQRWLRQIAKEYIASSPVPMHMVWVGQPALAKFETLQQLRTSLLSRLELLNGKKNS